MRRSAFWLMGLLSASCAVRGFTIQDELPGDNGGSGGSSAGNATAGSGASSNQGGDGSGASTQGGKSGTGGVQNEAGMPATEGGEPGVGAAGEGAGGAPPATIAPCDEVDGQAPLLCDDFESGDLTATKWQPGPGVGVATGEGPFGPTQLVPLTSSALGTQLGERPVSDVGSVVTVSFWVKLAKKVGNESILSLRDQSGDPTSFLHLAIVQKELGFRSTGSNFFVPQLPLGDDVPVNVWTCVSLTLRAHSLELRYQVLGSPKVSVVIADDEPTPNVDTSWQNLPSNKRRVLGYPAFGGTVLGVSAEIELDDVRVVSGTSNVCGL